MHKRSSRGAAQAARGGMPGMLAGARARRAQVTSGKLEVRALERSQQAVRDAHDALRNLKLEPAMYATLSGRQLPPGKLVAEAHGFNVCFQHWVYRKDLDFRWRGNVRVALKGGNGSGKTTLVKALLGHPFKTRGELRRGEIATLYIDQRCSTLDDERSLLENVLQFAPGPVGQVRTALATFQCPQEQVFQRTGELSGGERLRVALAHGFLGARQPELLVLDEPTNNLDLENVVFSREARGRIPGGARGDLSR